MKPDQRSKGDPPSLFVRSKDWFDAFEDQCTEEMMQRARRYAARRAHGIGHVTDSYYAGELVQDALADTLIGVLHWDPSAKTLQRHLHDAIKMRTHHDRKRARRFPHESIDALTPDGEAEAIAEVDAALLERVPDAFDDPVALAAERVAKLRQLAAGDRIVLRLLDALAAGATSKADILRVADLSNVAYDNARRRLRRFVTQLSDQPSRTALLPQKETEHVPQ
jgi:hypothetical protein